MGDRKWGELLQQHHVIVRRELARFRGREVNTAGDGFLIAFDGPGRAHPLWDEHLAAGTPVGHRHRVETLFP
jgi:class 3 adenylate cyclase